MSLVRLSARDFRQPLTVKSTSLYSRHLRICYPIAPLDFDLVHPKRAHRCLSSNVRTLVLRKSILCAAIKITAESMDSDTKM